VSPLKPVVIQTRRGLVAVVMVACCALPFAGWVLGSRQNDQCKAIHRIVEAGVRILDSPRNLRIAYAQGKITRAQYTASLTQIHRFDPVREQNLRDWRSADCQP
jgi:hypothetical protein